MDFTGKKILMLGIGGIGVSALARYAATAGANVSGCDAHHSEILDRLSGEGIKILDEAGIIVTDYDMIIRSNAVPPSNNIVQNACGKGIPVFRRGEILSSILSGRRSIAVTGSHGKTTISFMIGHLLKTAGLDPVIYCGGIGAGYGTNLVPGRGDWFVAEMDESDRTFVSASPSITVISNIELEHVNQYPTLALQVEAFEEYVSKLKTGSLLIVNGDDLTIRNLSRKRASGVKCIYCGFGADNDYIIRNFTTDSNGVNFSVENISGICEYTGRVIGAHNVFNMALASALARQIKIPDNTVSQGFKTFEGVGRRCEFIRELPGGGRLISDYGHHPTEIQAVLKAMKGDGSGIPVAAVFEPHRFSRLQRLMDDFARALSLADRIVITDVYNAGEPGDSASAAREFISKSGPEKTCYIKSCDIVKHIEDTFKNGERVVVFSAGSLDYRIRCRHG